MRKGDSILGMSGLSSSGRFNSLRSTKNTASDSEQLSQFEADCARIIGLERVEETIAVQCPQM